LTLDNLGFSGPACASDAECCAGVCSGGNCCMPPGASCGNDGDCCDGYFCGDGACSP
jgi:hypothetical protein